MASATNSAVKFAENSSSERPDNFVQNEERTKFLTMKYGQNEIKLIQKRLKIEFWMDAELNRLYEIEADSMESYPFDVDLDEVLDIETTEKRRQYLSKLLTDCKKPEVDIKKFLDELLAKMEQL